MIRRKTVAMVLISIVTLLGASVWYVHKSYLAPAYPTGEWTAQCSDETTTRVQHKLSQQAKDILLRALDEDNGAGMTAAVAIDGTLVWQSAVGMANKKYPLSLRARLRTGSISKVFASTLALKLAETGELDIDASIRRYVPELDETYEPITIRHLATHTSGIRQYNFADLRDSNNTVYYSSLSESFGRFYAEPPRSAAGDRFEYSSIAVNLLGLAVERASGLTYPDALDELIVKPLGLANTTVDDSAVHTECRPAFYTVLFGNARIPTLWRDNSDIYPSGGLLSSVNDLTRFAHTVHEGSFLSSKSQQTMNQKAMLTDGTVTNRGFGWEIRTNDDGSVEWIGHGGTVNGSYASLRHYPQHNMTVAGITNYDLQLTDQRAAFFRAIRSEIPALFSKGDPDEFED